MQEATGDTRAVHPGSVQPSTRRYATAVGLSAVLGFCGVHLFYLGRHAEGLLDVGLSLGWLVCFALGEIWLGLALLAADGAHALAVTILLLTGNFRDGDNNVVCYPGQRLRVHRG